MKRTIELKPNSIYELPSPNDKHIDPGTSPYWWVNTPTYNLWETWADELSTTYFYAPLWKTGQGLPGNWSNYVGFESPPTLILINKVTILTKFDYAQAGPNNWYFPPNNSYGPRVGLRMKGRDGTTDLVGPTYTILESDNLNVNVNQNPYFHFDQELEWVMTAHPEGGPWTWDDVYNLKAGTITAVSNGPNGHPFDDSQGGHFKIRYPYFRVFLDVEDLGGYVANVRNSASIILRLMRRARNVVKPSVRIEHAVGEVGSRVYMTHSEGPSVTERGWGQRRLERRPGIVLKRKIFPESMLVEDEIFDLQHFTCLAWAAYRIDAPWSPELQGLALIDKGNGFTHVRADQDGWSSRPGDYALMRVLEDYPNLSFHGLAAQGGGDVEKALRNYDMTQSGWSETGVSGDFTGSSDSTVTLVEEQGYLGTAKLVYAGGTGGYSRSLGTLPYASGDYIHVRVLVKNSIVPTPGSQNLEWALQRSGGGLAATEYWNDTSRTWTTSPTYNAMASSDPSTEIVSDAIPLDAGGASSDPTYEILVGRFSSSISDCTFHIGVVNAQYTDNQIAGCRTPLVALDAELTRVADQHRMTNSLVDELWSYVRGTAVVEVQPMWRAEALPTDEVKPLIHAEHTTDTYDAIQFVAKTGSDDLVRFERAISGESTVQVDCPIENLDINRTHVLRAWARWLGSEGWDEYGPYSVEVGYAVFLEADGTLVQTSSVLGGPVLTNSVTSRDWLGIGNDSNGQYADAFVRMWEVRRNPIHRLEAIWRI